MTGATGPSCSTGAGWGECPVCGQLLPRDKLGLHAMACQVGTRDNFLNTFITRAVKLTSQKLVDVDCSLCYLRALRATVARGWR